MDGSYVRGRAFNLVLAGTGAAMSGGVEEACRYGCQAVDLAAGIGSARVIRYVRGLQRRLTFRWSPGSLSLWPTG